MENCHPEESVKNFEILVEIIFYTIFFHLSLLFVNAIYLTWNKL